MITPDALWTEALRQLDQAETEAARRVAIATLYYAIYHSAGSSLGLDTSASDSNHERLHGLLAGSREANHRRAAQRYRNLRTLRVRSHYYLHAEVSEGHVELALSHARAVRALLRFEPA
ncbi:hypothetical protein [Nannocystis punicea]|uniref:HEPN domain-containing protein n=1 Tax=Nannocystis punicea TaxID=2995304 RepID=A0ABY7H2E1_9BACT|nr:hypothetical protein [Nannocystis poenicansa]WAS93396.1 hypothetical protein O0S08_45205 [Nannocystis poenicansa]